MFRCNFWHVFGGQTPIQDRCYLSDTYLHFFLVKISFLQIRTSGILSGRAICLRSLRHGTAGNSAMVHGFGCRAGVSGDWTRVLWGNGPGIFAIGPQRIAQISRGYKVSKIVGVVCLAKKLQKMLDFCTCPCSISSFLFFQPKARNSFLSHPKVWELTTKASLPVVSLPAMCWAQS